MYHQFPAAANCFLSPPFKYQFKSTLRNIRENIDVESRFVMAEVHKEVHIACFVFHFFYYNIASSMDYRHQIRI